MSVRGRGWRPALRIARRQVRRNLGRSVLVAALVGLPVAGATIVEVLVRTVDAPERWTHQQIGDADAAIEVSAWFELPMQTERDVLVGWVPGVTEEIDPQRDPRAVDVAELLPAGTVLVPQAQTYSTGVSYDDLTVRSELQVAVFDADLTDHVVRLEGGRWPESGDEVMVSTALAERLDLTDDDGVLPAATLTFPDGPEVRVTGTAIDPFGLDEEKVVAAPGSQAATFAQATLDGSQESRGTMPGNVTYLADLPAGVDAMDLVMPLAGEGVRVAPRDVLLNPDDYMPDSYTVTSASSASTAALVALVVGLGLLEVVLLAGAAFAVGARRQVRDLGLMAAAGATANQVRRTVLAQGIVLGGLGAAMGVVAGAAIVVGGRPVWERIVGEFIESWHFNWVVIAVAAGVGVLSGLAAAVVPARGAARMRPVDALARRFRTSRIAARLPVVGLVLILVGGSGALLASRMLAGGLREYGEALQRLAGTGVSVEAPNSAAYVIAQLAGAVLVITGLLISLPGLISVLARGAHRLGISPRMALRDAARHRHRTAPAVAAIVIVVAGSTGMAFGLGGTQRADELRYVPAVPDDVMYVEPNGLSDADIERTTEAAVQIALDVLPDARTVESRDTAHGVVYPGPADASAAGCPECVVHGSLGLAVADADVMELAAGRAPSQAELDAVAAGQVVVYNESYVDADGNAVIEVYSDDLEPTRLVLPGHAVTGGGTYERLPGAFASAETLAAADILVEGTSTYVVHGDAGQDQVDETMIAAEAAGARLVVAEPPEQGGHPAALGLTVASGFVTLVGVAIAVSLAAAEGRADLATLAAVGAPPRRRRSLAGAQAFVVGGIGVVLGSGLGVYFAYLAWPALGLPHFVWSWETLVVTGVVVPVLAVLVAVACTPSRLPMARRLE
ncbi:ABC transporter permease [Jiangella gansuensis]|uniref:ABC transporter permease n=1 Tax=Jiangella gansuensis TaxID=281473 RepID=UPI00047C374B|nr:ABC transporter permease [Jiangella gansuensis]